MDKLKLPIPMFRLGQYSYTTAKFILTSERPILATTAIRDLDDILIRQPEVTLSMRLPDVIGHFTSRITPPGDGVTRRHIIDAARQSIRRHYLETRTQNPNKDLPLIDRLLVDVIWYDRETRTLYPEISSIPTLSKTIPRDPGF